MGSGDISSAVIEDSNNSPRSAEYTSWKTGVASRTNNEKHDDERIENKT